jgi:protein-S-isoprenylcysteine O-methyltransferase Ste14
MASLPTKVALASALFSVVHTIVASDRAKSKWPFPRETYRVFYNAQAIVTFGALTAYIAAQPKETIYRARGPAALLLRIGQWSGVAFAVAAARETGIAKLAGFEPPPPAAQGPELGEDGALHADGPFRLVRHPLNLAPLAPFWLTPHMTTRRLAFNVVATAYLVIGSLHEEKRLLRQYGEQYERYRRSGVPFYLPRVKRLP